MINIKPISISSIFFLVISCAVSSSTFNIPIERLPPEDPLDITWLISPINNKTRIDFAKKNNIQQLSFYQQGIETQLHFTTEGHLQYQITAQDTINYQISHSAKKHSTIEHIFYSYTNKKNQQEVIAISNTQGTLQSIVYQEGLPSIKREGSRFYQYYYQIYDHQKKLTKIVLKSTNGQTMLTTLFTYDKLHKLVKKEELPGDFWDNMKYESGPRHQIYTYKYTKDTVLTNKGMITFHPNSPLIKSRITHKDTTVFLYTFH
jgi:hypothetical protein